MGVYKCRRGCGERERERGAVKMPWQSSRTFAAAAVAARDVRGGYGWLRTGPRAISPRKYTRSSLSLSVRVRERARGERLGRGRERERESRRASPPLQQQRRQRRSSENERVPVSEYIYALALARLSVSFSVLCVSVWVSEFMRE